MNNSSISCNPLNSQEISLSCLLILIAEEKVHILQTVEAAITLDLIQSLVVIHIQLVFTQYGDDAVL